MALAGHRQGIRMFGVWQNLGQDQMDPNVPPARSPWYHGPAVQSGTPWNPAAGAMNPIPGSDSPGGLTIIPGTPFGDCFLQTSGTAEDEQNCINQTTSSVATSGTLFGSTFLRSLFGGGTAVRPAGSDVYSTVPDSAPASESGFQLTNIGAVIAIGVLAFFALKR